MKKIEKARYFFAGMLITVLLGTMVVPSLAKSTVKKIDAYFNDIKVYFNDNLIVLKDASGNIIEPFTYNGTIYLPVRAIANALGQSVAWEGKTSSVYLGKHNSDTPVAYLGDMDYFYAEGSGLYRIGTAGIKDNIGNTNYKGLGFYVGFYGNDYSYSTGSGNRVYLINQKYTHFKGIIALTDKDKSSTEISIIKIYGDDKLLYASPEITRGVYPENFDVDVEGVVQLKIEWSVNPGIIFSGLDFYNY